MNRRFAPNGVVRSMRFFLLFLTAAAWAQTPAAKTATPAAPASQTRPAASAPASAAKPAGAGDAKAGDAKAMTDNDKIIYALGLSVSRSLGQFELTPAELEIVKRAMTDAAAGKPAVDIETWGPKIQQLATSRAAVAATRQKAASATFLTKAAAEPGAKKTASGLIYKELRAGTGATPGAADNVKVNYRGTLVDGTEFDSSYKRGTPATFILSGVIKCWTEGVQLMKVGGKARLVCPSALAYGEQGAPGIPGGSALVFEVELLDVTRGK